jgi:hypothetical protein
MKDPIVTQEMIDAGDKVASDLITAYAVKSLNGRGGGPTINEWIDKDIPNKDLIQQYLDKTIDSVTAIYLAMHRERPEIK